MKYGQVYNVPEGMSYDDYSIDILWDVIETKSKYNNVYVKVHNDKYSNQDLDEKIVERFTGGIINENDKYGYIDENMNITIPVIYNGIYDLTITNKFLKTATGEKFEIDYSNYVRISNDNGNGIATKQGKILMECQYGNIIYYGYNTFVVTKKVNDTWKMGVVDINNNIVIDFIDGFMSQYYFTSTQYAIYSVINDNHGYEGVIDRNFNIILEPIYSDVTMWDIDFYNSDGIYKEEYFDKNNKYHEDYFVVEKDGKRAVLDVEGNIKIDYCNLSVYQLWNQYEKTVRNSMKK